MAQPPVEDLLRQWQAAMQSVISAVGSAAGGSDAARQLVAPMRRQTELLEQALEVHHTRGRSTWRVVIVQEGRVVGRTRLGARRATGSFRLERRLRDLAGADRVSVRAAGPQGVTCRASATLPGA